MKRRRRLKGLMQRKDAAARTSKLFAALGTTRHTWLAERRQRWNSGTFGPASPVRVLVRDGKAVEPAHG